MRPFDGRRVLLVVSGGIAAYKSVVLARRLVERGAAVDVLLTSAAQEFVGAATFEGITARPTHADMWERPMAHLELGRSADAVAVAPATADLLSKLARGAADDLAATTLLAAPGPVLLCPAMNTRMWEHPATAGNVERLRGWGYRMVGPEAGELAEGEVGIGRMAEPDAIVAELGRMLERRSPLAGRRVVVTAGPTRAPLDPVRFVGNRSSGRMGYALAASAWRRGAEVALITGPGHATRPYGPRAVEVETAEEMLGALRDELPGAAALLMAAAVVDFAPERPEERKLKKRETDGLEVKLVRGPDLLVETRDARRDGGILSVGFALETDAHLENARRKLEEKDLDLVALNDAADPTSGFDVPTNRVTILDRDGEVEELPLLSKEEVADRLLDRVEVALEGDGGRGG